MEGSGQFHTPVTLLPQKEPLVPIGQEADWAVGQSGRSGEEKNFQPLPGLEPPIIQPIAQCYITELSQLMLISFNICKCICKGNLYPYFHIACMVYFPKDYDIVIWSATSMKWIEEKMKLLGVSTHSDYKVVFYLDNLAMISIFTPKYGVVQVRL
jgi:hypothetical protein